jgi:hypothetical protein
MFTSINVTADLAADRRRTLTAEADAYRLVRVAQSTRGESRFRWAWTRLRSRAGVALSAGPA